MKLIKYEHREGLLTADAIHVSADSSITIDATVANAYSDLFIDFVPRDVPMVQGEEDGGLYSIVENEFTKCRFTVPCRLQSLGGGVYRLYFVDTLFIRPESKYSISVFDLGGLLYQGKMIHTLNSDIQNFRYTKITDNKFYL